MTAPVAQTLLVLRGLRRRRWLWMLDAAVGAAAVLAYAPWQQWPLMLLALAWLASRLQAAATAASTFAVAFAFGWGHALAGVGWLSVALARYGGLPWPLAWLAVALFAAYLALWWGIPAAAWQAWRQRLLSGQGLGTRAAVAWAALWMLSFWVCGWWFSGFPWLSPGLAFALPEVPLVGFFPLMGMLGVGALAVGLSAYLTWGLRRWSRWLVAFLILAVGGALSQKSWTEPKPETVAVTVIQTAVAQDRKFLPPQWEELLSSLERALASARGQVVVAPETVLPLFADRIPPSWWQRLETAAKGKSFWFGVFARSNAGIHNAFVSLDQRQYYAKRQLVPFGEYTPAGFSGLMRFLQLPFADQAPGARDQPLWAYPPGSDWAPNICYESVFSSLIAHDVRRGAEVLLNVANMAWYGESHAAAQHAQHGRARALETGRPWVQAVNGGISAAYGPDGRLLAAASPWQAALLEVTVMPHRGLTPFVRWGGEGALALLAVALLVLVMPVRKRKQP